MRSFSKMPGANCFIFGCGTNRRHSGVGSFRTPAGKDEKSKEIRNPWIKVVARDRVVVEVKFCRIYYETVSRRYSYSILI